MADPEANTPSTATIEVLIVEDAEITRQIVVEFLGALGFHVVCAGDGAEALQLLEGWTPHVIVMDAQMSGVDGVSAVRALRASPEPLPVIAISGSGSPMQEGGTQVLHAPFLPKPFSPDALLAEVARTVRA